MIVDPVGSPDAYRRMLLDALGDDDPADVLAVGPERARAIVRDAADLLRQRPEPAEWSVAECLAHLADSELIMAARSRWILAEDEPDIVGYDQDAWVTNLRQGEVEDPASLLAVFAALRHWNLDLWMAAPTAARERIGRHRERGPESYGLMIRLAAGHDRIHLAQAEQALTAVRAATIGASSP